MLKCLEFSLPAEWVYRENFKLGMRHLPSLKQLDILLVVRKEASDQEADEAEAALRAAAEAEDHPNHPILRYFEARVG